MKIDEVMTTDVVTVGVDTPLKQAATLLARHGISGLPVVDESGAVVGVLSEADILVKEGGAKKKSGGVLGWLLEPSEPWLEEKLEAVTAGEAMTAPALTITPDRPVREAALTMLEEGVNRLPVVDDAGKLVGIVSRANLVRAFTRTDAEIAKEIETDVLRRTLWLEPGSVRVAVEDGNVALEGRVETEGDVELLTTMARRVPGVVSVTSTVVASERVMSR